MNKYLKINRIFLLSLWLIFSSFAIAGEQISDNVTVAYYEVLGQNSAEIRRQLNDKGPFDEAGDHHDALTKWRVYWTWPSDGRGRADRSKAEVKVRIVLIFPRLSAESHIDRATETKWRNYCLKLRAHEDLHIKIARECRAEIEAAIRGATGNDGDAVARKILKKYQELEIEMDRKTNHGMNDGATFP